MLKRTALNKPRAFKNNSEIIHQKTPEIEALDNPFLLLKSWLTLKQKILLTREFAKKKKKSRNQVIGKKNCNVFCEERFIYCNKPTDDTAWRVQISSNLNQKIL